MTGIEAVEAAFRSAREGGRMAFIPYVTAGDPDLDGTRRMAAALVENGADLIELGVPWSDPLADGPVNQRAAERAMASGTTLGGILDAIPGIKQDAPVPLVLFTYFNPVLRHGLDRFAREAADAGVDGVLVTDLPPEEAADYRGALAGRGLAAIFLATPTSTESRLRSIARSSTGFVYAVSRTGVTGAQTSIRATLHDLLDRLRRHTALPVAVGFGIATPEQVSTLRGTADGFVVGSALVDRIERHGAGADGIRAVTDLARELVAAAR